MRVCPYCHLVRTQPEPVCPLGEQAREVTFAALPDALQSKFSELEPFACGNTGSSFLAKQQGAGYRGVLKIISLEGQGASERMRLKRELRKQTKLTNNSLVRIIDGGEIGPLLWLFRDHVEGESLALAIRKQGRIELPEALATIAQLASALDELHRAGLLHRDVKPGHVILEPRDEGVPLVRVIDAGVAARIATGSVFDLVGTPAYMSPEQIAGKLVSFRSDLYSLGCVLYEMLTGRPPFEADSVDALLSAHKEQPAPALPEEIPTAVRSLTAALLEKEPRKRPFSAQQVRRTLEPLLPASTPSAQSATRTSAGNVRAPRTGAFRTGAGLGAPRASAVDLTEEIELEELEEDSGIGTPRNTVNLSPEEVEALTVEDSGATAERTMRLEPEEVEALTVENSGVEANDAAEHTMHLEPDDVDAMKVGDEAEPEAAIAAQPERARDAAPEDGAAPEDAAALEPAAESEPPRSVRPSVDFDVESLFDDDVAEPRQRSVAEPVAAASDLAARDSATDDAAAPDAEDDQKKTEIYRGAAAAYAPVRVSADEASAETNGTVVVARQEATKKPPFLLIGAGVLLLLVIAWLAFGGSEDEAAASEERGEQAEPSTSAAPAAQPVDDEAAPADPAAPAAEQAAAEPEPQGETGAEAEAEAEAEDSPEGEATEGEAGDEEAVAGDEGDRKAAEATAKELAASGDTGGRVGRASGSRADRVAKAKEYKEEARAHYQAARYRDAANSYEKATQQTPTDAGAFAGLGASLLAADKVSDAVRAYQRAVRLQPKSSGFHAALGRAYVQQGDRARARAAYERALKLNPKNGAAKTALERLK